MGVTLEHKQNPTHTHIQEGTCIYKKGNRVY